jgi:hypothetical protein
LSVFPSSATESPASETELPYSTVYHPSPAAELPLSAKRLLPATDTAPVTAAVNFVRNSGDIAVIHGEVVVNIGEVVVNMNSILSILPANMYRKIGIFCCVCMLFGCSNRFDGNTKLEIIDLVEGIGHSTGDIIFLSEVAEDIDFVALETNDQCLIGRNPYLFFSDTNIIVFDSQQDKIFLFDRKTGKFIRETGRKGQGPGEYTDLSALFVVSGDNLFLWDYKGSILRYDLKTGKCINEKYCSSEYESGYFNPAAIGCMNDSLLVIYTKCPDPGLDPKGFSHLYVTDYDFTVTYGACPNNKYTAPVTEEEFNSIEICRYTKDGYMHIWRNDDGIIHRITGNLEIIPKYKLFLGQYDPIGKSNNFGDRKFMVIGIQETGRFFFIAGIFNYEYAMCIVYDKVTKKSRRLRFVDGYGDNFYNDIDGSIGFWPQGYVSENVLYSYGSVAGVKRMMNHPSIRNIELKNKEKHQKIKDYLLSADEDDNPIIFFVTMK